MSQTVQRPSTPPPSNWVGGKCGCMSCRPRSAQPAVKKQKGKKGKAKNSGGLNE